MVWCFIIMVLQFPIKNRSRWFLSVLQNDLVVLLLKKNLLLLPQWKIFELKSQVQLCNLNVFPIKLDDDERSAGEYGQSGSKSLAAYARDHFAASNLRGLGFGGRDRIHQSGWVWWYIGAYSRVIGCFKFRNLSVVAPDRLGSGALCCACVSLHRYELLQICEKLVLVFPSFGIVQRAGCAAYEGCYAEREVDRFTLIRRFACRVAHFLACFGCFRRSSRLCQKIQWCLNLRSVIQIWRFEFSICEMHRAKAFLGRRLTASGYSLVSDLWITLLGLLLRPVRLCSTRLCGLRRSTPPPNHGW